MGGITYDNMTKRLVEALPELAEAYQAELKWWGEDEVTWWGEEEPPNHVLYANLLHPFLVSLLEGDTQEELTVRVFAFLEELSQAEHDVRNVVEVTVLESLVGTELWEKAETYMGTETRRIARKVEEWAHGG